MTDMQSASITSPVALYARAWVEMLGKKILKDLGFSVALYARAWVEIFTVVGIYPTLDVALYARAWVEICRVCDDC